MIINKKLIKYNFTPNANFPIYIVIHDTGNYQTGANAEMHYRYFNEGNKDASAHVFVDNTQILQIIEFKDKAWHCGDGGGKYGINNANSIGIEICINKDGDYNKTLEMTSELVAFLMNTFKIPLERVVRHYDASRKNCPQTMNNNGDWTRWNLFKQAVNNKFQVLQIPQWQIDCVNWLRSKGIITSDHSPVEPVTMKLFGYMMNNYLTKIATIDPMQYLTQNGYIKSPHDPNEVIALQVFAFMMANKLKASAIDPIEFLLQKGFITTKRDGNEVLTFWLFSAMLKNYQDKGMSYT